MTDHDRGAYTPQPDAPLQFDARGPRGRKPMPMTLIGSAAVLVVLLGALALHYRNDSKRGSEPVRPVGEPVAQIKTAVPASTPPKDAATGVDVFNGASQPAKAPTFAPAPEEAKPRQQLTVQAFEPNGPKTQVATTAAPAPTTVATAKPTKPAATVAATAKPAPTPAYHAPPATTAQPAPARPDATSVVAKLAAAPVAKPAAAPTIALRPTAPAIKSVATPPAKTVAATAPAKATPAKAAPTAAASGSVVQIGAFSSAALSDKGWSDVSAAMTGEMGGKAKRVEPVEVNGHTLYRTSVTGFASRAAAEAFCKALVAKGHTCFAKG